MRWILSQEKGTNTHARAKFVNSVPDGDPRMQGPQVTNTWFRASVLAVGTQALPPQGLLGKLETGILRGSISEYWECRWCQNSSKGRLFHLKACTWKQCGRDFL